MNQRCVLLVVLWLLGAGAAAGHAIQGVYVNSEGPFTCSAETLDEVGDFVNVIQWKRGDFINILLYPMYGVIDTLLKSMGFVPTKFSPSLFRVHIGEVRLDSLMKQAVWKDPTLLAELIDNIRSLVFDACEIEVKEIFWITCGCNARR